MTKIGNKYLLYAFICKENKTNREADIFVLKNGKDLILQRGKLEKLINIIIFNM